MAAKKARTHKVTLEFDNHEAAHGFFANWLDGGGDGGGNLDWHTTKWDQKHTYMRIKGTGYAVEWENGEAVVMTPEVEQARFEKRKAEFLARSKSPQKDSQVKKSR